MNSIKDTYRTFFKYHSINEDAKLLIGVSGGVDSMVALALALEEGVNISVAHVNYELRGKESEKETALVESFCKKHDIKCFVIYKNAILYANENILSIQEAAREIRYIFFEDLVSKHNFDFVVTAHHKEDNIETLLLNAIRGSGTKGLSAIPKIRNQFIRPFLSINKEDIINYAHQLSIPFLNDSSNLSSKYDRNFIRNEITPLLKSRFSNFLSGLELTIENISSENKLLKMLVQEKLAPFIKHKNDSTYISTKASISIEIWYHYLKDYGFNLSQINDLTKKEHQSGRKFISNSHVLFIDRENWIIQKLQDSNNEVYFIDEKLNVNTPFNLIAKKTTVPSTFSHKEGAAYFDFKNLIFPLKVRKWRKGDFFTPFGMKNKKKISDFLIDKKTPLPDKKNTWVVESNNEIIWVVNHRISEHYKITDSTKSCLLLYS